MEATTMGDRKKYNGMETYLQRVSGAYISVPKHVKTRNNRILKKVLEILIKKMKNTDTRFNQLYQKLFFGGSYYDGLKVGTPDEYDIDLLLQFPSSHGIEIRTGKVPGYVNLHLKNITGFEKFCGIDEKGNLYLDTKKVLSWMESVITRAFEEFKSVGSWYIFGKREKLHVRYHKTDGPAFTLVIKANDEEMNVDLVPCFLFEGDKWPAGFKKYKKENGKILYDFFVVPKHPKNVTINTSKYWRLSFQIQERHFIHDKGRLKPALKLLKKLRDAQQHKKLYSYYLKTVVLWEVLKNPEPFWIKNSLSYVFMHLLKECQKCLENEKILYFWTVAEFNLLETVKVDWSNISNRLSFIINKIERNLPNSPDVILKFILTPDELAELYPKVTFPIDEEEAGSSCTLL